MNHHTDTETAAVREPLVIKVFGVGGAGGNAVSQILHGGFTDVSFTVLNTDAQALAQIEDVTRFQLGPKVTRGLGAGGDPELGRAAAEADLERLREVCAGADMVFLIAGLGGGTGTGAGPVIARIAREAGALVLAFVTLPFECEGVRRQRQARAGLEQLKAAADGVICLPNQKVLKLIDEHTSLMDTFSYTNELLAQGVRGIWRLLTHTGLINIDFADLCAVVRGRHAESSFATAEAAGANRAREAVEKLLANPLLDGDTLAQADAVLVSLMGDASLTMAEVSRVMEQINRRCENAHVIMGAAIDEGFADRLSVTLVASRRSQPGRAAGATPAGGVADADFEPAEKPEFDTQFLHHSQVGKPTPRFIAPPPETTPEKAAELLAQQAGAGARKKRKPSKMLQKELPLQIVSKGRFEKSEPTLHNGEDLDVPTYVRRGIALN